MAGKKSSIYYARTYRKLKSGRWKGILLVCILIFPALFLMLWKCSAIQIVESDFPVVGKISMVELPTVYPGLIEVIVNLLVMMGLVIFACTGKRKGKPAAIYSVIVLVTHLINCIYFLFAGNYFPYTGHCVQSSCFLGDAALFRCFWCGAVCFFSVYS